VPSSSRSVVGYTARRCGEAGSAPGVEEGRKTSRPGSAENGLPPATGAGETASDRPPLPVTPHSAGRACEAHRVAGQCRVASGGLQRPGSRGTGGRRRRPAVMAAAP
jgi:hypothetical protein